MIVDVASILGPDGLVANRLDEYEHRPQQLEMAHAVTESIAAGRHLVIEAGTGIGKSFAYLVPAILAATADQSPAGRRQRIVISTHTISLQEQLISRDLPFLNAVLPLEFSAVLVKGRGNYISRRRLAGALSRERSMFTDPEELSQLEQLVNWSTQTTDGSRADLDFRPLGSVWDEVGSDRGNCLRRNCPTYEDCFYYRARRRTWNADILVVNHALFFSDLSLRRDGGSLLPEYDVVILDEAHTVEAVAADHLGLTATSGQLDFTLNRLYNDRNQRGLLVHHQRDDLQRLTLQARLAGQQFFDELRSWQEQHAHPNGRVLTPPPLNNSISHELSRLANSVAELSAEIEPDEERIELTSAAERIDSLSLALETWLAQGLDDAVYWIETRRSRRRTSTRLVSSPIDIGPILRETLFQQVRSVVLTSATLAVGEENFDFFTGRLGVSGADLKRLGSPFDYQSQCRLILPATMPDPSRADDYANAATEAIRRHVESSQGRALVLFTSYSMLRHCGEALASWFEQQGLVLFCQGEDLSRTAMLDRFREEPRAVLFGTESFWQGIDVPGDALQTVIITRLPFSVPDHPLLEARLDRIRQRGGNPFLEYQLPEAVIKLKQGFGRLIRRNTDTGRVVILDPRICSKPYGRVFLESLPECRIEMDDGWEEPAD